MIETTGDTAEVQVLPAQWKCVRCRQHKPECAPEANNYGLCLRCQNYMQHVMNSRCVDCGNDDAVDNLCMFCRGKRIAAYDKALIDKMLINKDLIK